MGSFAVFGVRVLLSLFFALGLFAQAFAIPHIVNSTIATFPEIVALRWPGILVGCALVLCLQIAIVCIWRLLTRVERMAIFERGALVPVNTMVGSFVGVAACGVIGILILAGANVGPPSIMLLLIALVVVGVGLALLMWVMRELLIRASHMGSELAEVI